MPFIKVQDRPLHYQVPSGVQISRPRAQIVLLVHGAFDNHAFWRYVYQHLEANYTPVAIDLPGHGRSEGPALQGASEYLAFFAELVAVLDLPRFVFCGHSMGGSMAVEFALHHADRLSAIVLVSSAPAWEVTQTDIDIWDNDPDQAFRANMGYLFARETSEVTRAAYDRQMRSTASQSCKADLETCRSFDLTGRLGDVAIPTSVICGDQEFWIEGSKMLHSGIPESRYEVVAAAGHAIAIEQPAALNVELDRFLASLV